MIIKTVDGKVVAQAESLSDVKKLLSLDGQTRVSLRVGHLKELARDIVRGGGASGGGNDFIPTPVRGKFKHRPSKSFMCGICYKHFKGHKGVARHQAAFHKLEHEQNNHHAIIG